jgi:hypothetical protein
MQVATVPDAHARSLMTPAVSIAAVCAAGALIGGLYTLSPITFWFGVAMVGLFAWTGRGLEGRERTWVFALLGLAVALRLLALAIFFFLTNQGGGIFSTITSAYDDSFPVLIPDEWYLAYRARLLRYTAIGVPLSHYEYVEVVRDFGYTSVNYARAYLQLLVGEAPFTIRLFDTGLYLAACAALYRTVRPTFGALAALGGFGVVLFLPSLFVWSISALKDAPSLFFTAVSVWGAGMMVRTSSLMRRLLAVGIVTVAIFSLGAVRPGAEVIVGGGIVTGLLGTILLRWPVLLATTLVLCVAGTAWVLQRPVAQEWTKAQLAVAGTFHVGYVRTPGWNYRVLDPGFYTPVTEHGTIPDVDPNRFTVASTARYVIRATTSALVVPLPWQARSLPALAYQPEQLALDLLLLFAVVGVVAGLRLDMPLTVMLTGVIVIGAVLIGMTSGNVGTLIRHRAMVILMLPWLGSLGACEVLAWAARFSLPARLQGERVVRDRGFCAVD